jgi:hypothetical protein
VRPNSGTQRKISVCLRPEKLALRLTGTLTRGRPYGAVPRDMAARM